MFVGNISIISLSFLTEMREPESRMGMTSPVYYFSVFEKQNFSGNPEVWWKLTFITDVEYRPGNGWGVVAACNGTVPIVYSIHICLGQRIF